MTVIGSNALAGASGQVTGGSGSGGGYQISRSLRFNSGDSSYLSRTPSSAGNRKTWTWSGWVKRSKLGATQGSIFGAGTSDFFNLYFPSGDELRVIWTGNTLTDTTALIRDPSAWYHIVLAVDTTQSTASDRIKIYVNGILQDRTATTPSQNYDTAVNNNVLHAIGNYAGSSTYFNGYLADVQFLDGIAASASDFGETDSNGVWQPKAYSGSYGTNGFHLKFEDNSSNAALGTDSSSNSNTWTVNNLSVAAGSGNDSLLDTPNNNFATWNAINNNLTLSNGNLEAVSTNNTWRSATGTIAMTSGKWYWEVTATTVLANVIGIGRASASNPAPNSQEGWDGSPDGYSYYQNGVKYHDGSTTPYGNSYTNGDVIGVAWDADAGNLVFYKNGVSQGTAWSGLTGGPFVPVVSCYSSSASANFGQRPFAYSIPSGYSSLNTESLPDPTIADGSQYFDAKLFTGNGSTQSISSLSFSPDFLWIKSRNAAYDHYLQDSVRGATKTLESNQTGDETTNADGVSSFDTNGFSVGAGTGYTAANVTNINYVAWAWNAGSSTVTNTDGSISSQVRANPTAGFSIVTYTGSGLSSTIGHGLNAAPELIITKNRESSAFNWGVYHVGVGNTKYGSLNSTATFTTQATWQNTTPSSSVFYVGNFNTVNQTAEDYVAYCFAPVDGFCSIGSYIGTGTNDNAFVYCGFKPKFVMFKGAIGGGGNWMMLDTSRRPYPTTGGSLEADRHEQEDGYYFSNQVDFDFLSNGFKIRHSGSPGGDNGRTYIYLALAEHPFKTARGYFG